MAQDSDWSQFSMLDLFRLEIETQVTLINQNLLVLETQPNAVEALQALMRAAHSIKGAARIVNLDAVVQVAHVMEDCFVEAQAGHLVFQADGIDLLLQGADWFTQLAGIPEADLPVWLEHQQNTIAQWVEAIAQLCHASPAAVSDTANLTAQLLANPIAQTTTLAPEQVSQSLNPEVSTVVAVADPVVPTLPEPSSGPPLAEAIAQPPSSSGAPFVPTAASSDRIVRVSAENLSRLMSLAGESLVEANWLQPFADTLFKLRTQQAELGRTLEKLQESFGAQALTQQSESYLNNARQQAATCHELLSDRLNDLELFSRRFNNLSDRLYREVIASHMRPFADGVEAFPRMVRDLAKQLGKQVRFEILGKTTKVDRDILEKLEAPLIHLLRNAIDHGIESPADRLTAGKSSEGRLRLEATHRAGMLLITISDDGRGIDLEQMRQSVVARQLVTAEMSTQLSEAELLEFLFLPGFSTKGAVTEISGRGVGLDAVQSMVRQVGGGLRVSTQSGQGLTIHLQLPLTLSVIRTLLVEIAGEPYAFPLARIDRVVRIEPSAIALAENRPYFTVNQQNIGLIDAHQVLELGEAQGQFEFLSTVVISDRMSCYGLVVDRILEERDLVVRPLDPRLGKVKNISSAALLEDGSPVLLIDVEDMLRSIDHLLAKGHLNSLRQGSTSENVKLHKRILVVDDSITVREMERKLLQNQGYQVEVAVDGMDGWNAVRTNPYDLVITDIDMPRLNGIELIQQIRQHNSLKSTPVIIVSYKDREEDCLQGLEAGANYYLTKSSFHDNTLIQAVVDLIGETA